MNLTYSMALSQDSQTICAMIGKVFGEFVAPGYEQKGVDTFLDYAEASAMAKRLESDSHFGFTSKDENRIAGYIEVRGNEHISLMFVDKEYHIKGICRELFGLAKSECLIRNPELKQISVNSSPYAVTVYERLGFSAIDVEQEKNGIRFVPMSVNV